MPRNVLEKQKEIKWGAKRAADALEKQQRITKML